MNKINLNPVEDGAWYYADIDKVSFVGCYIRSSLKRRDSLCSLR